MGDPRRGSRNSSANEYYRNGSSFDSDENEPRMDVDSDDMSGASSDMAAAKRPSSGAQVVVTTSEDEAAGPSWASGGGGGHRKRRGSSEKEDNSEGGPGMPAGVGSARIRAPSIPRPTGSARSGYPPRAPVGSGSSALPPPPPIPVLATSAAAADVQRATLIASGEKASSADSDEREGHHERDAAPSTQRDLPPPPPLFDFKQDVDQVGSSHGGGGSNPAITQLQSLIPGLPAKTGTGAPVIPLHPRLTAEPAVCPETEPLIEVQEDLVSQMLMHDAERMANPHTVMNRVVFDAIEPNPNVSRREQNSSSGPDTAGPSGGSVPSTVDEYMRLVSEPLAPYYDLSSEDDTTLVFESRFESGNLRRAIQVYPHEYDLILRPDINTRGRAVHEVDHIMLTLG